MDPDPPPKGVVMGPGSTLVTGGSRKTASSTSGNPTAPTTTSPCLETLSTSQKSSEISGLPESSNSNSDSRLSTEHSKISDVTSSSVSSSDSVTVSSRTSEATMETESSADLSSRGESSGRETEEGESSTTVSPNESATLSSEVSTESKSSPRVITPRKREGEDGSRQGGSRKTAHSTRSSPSSSPPRKIPVVETAGHNDITDNSRMEVSEPSTGGNSPDEFQEGINAFAELDQDPYDPDDNNLGVENPDEGKQEAWAKLMEEHEETPEEAQEEAEEPQAVPPRLGEEFQELDIFERARARRETPVEQTQHPMAPMFDKQTIEWPKDPVERAIAHERIDDVGDFRDRTKHNLVGRIQGDRRWKPTGKERKTVIEPRNHHSALYMVIEKGGGVVILTPMHLEVVAGDRPDLNFVQLSDLTFDTASKMMMDVESIAIGDIFYVEDLVPKRKALKVQHKHPRVEAPGPSKKSQSYPTELMTSWDHVTDHKYHNFWFVEKACQLRRNLEFDMRTMEVDTRVSKRDRRDKKPRFIVDRQFDVAELGIPLKDGVDISKTFYSDVLVPPTQPGQFIPSINLDTEGRNREAAEMVKHHNRFWNIPVRILSMRPMTKQEEARHDQAPMFFTRHHAPSREDYENLADVVKMGTYGAAAMQSANFDRRIYSGRIAEVQPFKKNLILVLSLENPPSESVAIKYWKKGTAVVLRYNVSYEVSCTVLSAMIEEDNSFVVKVRPLQAISAPRKPQEEDRVTIQHRKQDQRDHVARQIGKLEPPRISEQNIAMKALAAVHGGNRAPDLSLGNIAEYTVISKHDEVFRSTNEQATVLAVFQSKGWTLVVLACGPGAGKTSVE
ncbi:hypothetical protein B9Z55_028560 [Caenorhabditis nigoni]|uniref:Uncharacterized protein n=1 Tax=Caenorhabditis nigoni TaxID=1611254 RepID=A0A2G5SAV5_9PELO|nr:hypothetical protein B9Z55_028560 [Caenorhabditis nigoni]